MCGLDAQSGEIHRLALTTERIHCIKWQAESTKSIGLLAIKQESLNTGIK